MLEKDCIFKVSVDGTRAEEYRFSREAPVVALCWLFAAIVLVRRESEDPTGMRREEKQAPAKKRRREEYDSAR